MCVCGSVCLLNLFRRFFVEGGPVVRMCVCESVCLLNLFRRFFVEGGGVVCMCARLTFPVCSDW